MRELECFLFKYFRKRREEKSAFSKTRSEPNVVSGKHMETTGVAKTDWHSSMDKFIVNITVVMCIYWIDQFVWG